MRVNPRITDVWKRGGPYLGADRTHGRVTVQTPWPDIVSNPENVIFSRSSGLGRMSSRGPIRWAQRADNSQVELEIPNVKRIDINRSIEADAGTCEVHMINTWMDVNGTNPTPYDIGNPGYFNPYHGDDLTARARWGHQQNTWNRLLVPNAVLRTYQGYGGHGKTLENALTDGDLMLTGVWLVDRVTLTADGKLSLACRDMMKLLIDQQLFPPLVPPGLYPLKYCRYAYESRTIAARPGELPFEPDPADLEPGDRPTTYVDSSQDRWYGGPGSNASIHGHRGSDSVDGIDTSFALSVGNSGPDKIFSTVWWEYETSGGLNAVWLHPWAGGYRMYISVMEDGIWQGATTVPYDHRPLLGRQPTVVDTEADIPFVAEFDIPFEESREYKLPRFFMAQRVRLSFRRLHHSGIGPWHYRAGIREVKLRVTAGVGDIATMSSDQQWQGSPEPIFYAADAIRDLTDLNRTGYITVSNYGFVDVFGDCREYPPSRVDDATIAELLQDFYAAAGPDAVEVSSVALTPDGGGYWILYSRGIVRAFGNATYYGEPYDTFDFNTGFHGGVNKAATIVSTNSGLGYWVILWDGTIYSYGDAAAYPQETGAYDNGEIIHGACGHPGDDGLYLIASNGWVYALGAATWRGNYTESFNVSNTGQQEIAIDITATHDGGGYWILTTAGRIQHFGNAEDHGEVDDPIAAQNPFDRFYQLLPSPVSGGYLVCDGDGKIFPLGDVDFFGQPIPGEEGQLRKDGNYLDFVDIVKELALWSGFHLLSDTAANAWPAVHGNIESTGMFSKAPLPDEIFDKRPVIDAIHELKESVGYLVWVDDQGGLRFESPNWWGPGNFIENTGEHVDDVFEIDERLQLSEYQVQLGDENLRSSIIIASEDITGGGFSTIYTDFVPNTADSLRGIIKPAMWVNGFFQRRDEQRLMAELISLHIWFGQRVGQLRCWANPCIQVNDQVRVWERTTGESYLHYVRAVSSSHDLDTGEWTMQLDTNWLGDGDTWAVGDGDAGGVEQPLFGLSKPALEFMYRSPAGSVKAGGYEIKVRA